MTTRCSDIYENEQDRPVIDKYAEHREQDQWDTRPVRSHAICTRFPGCHAQARVKYRGEELCEEHFTLAFTQYVEDHQDMRAEGHPVDGHDGEGTLQGREMWRSPTFEAVPI